MQHIDFIIVINAVMSDDLELKNCATRVQHPSDFDDFFFAMKCIDGIVKTLSVEDLSFGRQCANFDYQRAT